MSDGITIPLDVDDTKAKGKIAQLKRDAGQAGKAFGQAGAQAARVGGAAGGALGRAVGGFSQGGAAGALGLGIAGGGMLLSSFLQRDAERVSAAVDRERRQQSRAADSRSVIKSMDSLAAGGLKYADKVRRNFSLGMDRNSLPGITKLGSGYGLTDEESLDAFAASKTTGQSMNQIMIGMSTRMLGGANETADVLAKFNGLKNAISAVGNMSAKEAMSVITSVESPSTPIKAINDANAAGNPVSQSQIASLLSGETAGAIGRDARDTLNPGQKLMLEASQRTMDTVNQLRAAADAQGTVAALLAEAGRVVGLSDGSAARKLAVGAQAAPK